MRTYREDANPRPNRLRRRDAAPTALRPRGKEFWPPGNILVPTPAVLVSCGRPPSAPNVATVAWCANVNSDPPMLSISLRPSRLSHELIVRDGEFVVNVPSISEERAVDYCGVVSGRREDKFAALGLTPSPMAEVEVFAIAECPLSIACRVNQRIPLGSHDLFIANVVSVAVDRDLVNGRGALSLERADLLCFAHGFYHELGKKRGKFGWSVEKHRK